MGGTKFSLFHSYNNFIFLELPKYSIAMLSFYDRIFDSNKEAYNKAMKLIREVY